MVWNRENDLPENVDLVRSPRANEPFFSLICIFLFFRVIEVCFSDAP